MFEVNRFEDVLKSLRVRRGKVWTQARMAQTLAVSLRTYVGWENGERLPSGRDLKNIAAAFQLSEADMDMLFRAASQVAPRIENLPYRRNAFFTGRDELLDHLWTALSPGQAVALSQAQALSGLGGIGKTQAALEFAYQHRSDYRTVLWILSDTRESLVSGYVAIAGLLHLPEKDEQDQSKTVEAVKRWFTTHTGWLLILDNVEDLTLVDAFLPSVFGGHLLLTTRAQATGTRASRSEVDSMSQEVGALFLLRRAKLLAPTAQLTDADEAGTAREICSRLGGLPLALDQAGAYIEETGCSLSDYLNLFEQRQKDLLERRGTASTDHPQSVAITLALAFEKVVQKNRAAMELLSLCSYLAPDLIPLELIIQSASHLGTNLSDVAADALQLDQALEILQMYSLVQRNGKERTLSVHRLVQAVLRDGMDEQTQSNWMQQAIQALNEAFPEVGFKEWTKCGRLLPHVLVCATWVEHEPTPALEASYLLRKAGNYLQERGQYRDAEPLLVRALLICEQQLGAEHPDTAQSLNNLAILYRYQGKYEQAEPLYQRALLIRERHLGTEHLDTAKSLNNLAELYRHQGRYEQAEPLYQRALSIWEQQLGASHPHIALSLNNLAVLYYQQGKYEQAEPLHQRVLLIREQHLGAEHPDTASSLNNLGLLYRQQGKYEQAEPLYQRALAIREQQLGAEHSYTAQSLDSLAILYWRQGKYEQAEPLYQRALLIRERHLGAEHPDTASSLNNLANLYGDQGKYEQAEPLHKRALAICEQQLGAEHPDTAQNLNNLAELYRQQGKYEQVEPLYERALSISEQQLGVEHPFTAYPLHGLAELYRHQGKYEQAESFYQRALTIRQQCLVSTHPDAQETRLAYAAFLRMLGRNAEAAMLDTDHEPPAEEGH